jgi:DNA-binding NarL/FixJ family response regulator
MACAPAIQPIRILVVDDHAIVRSGLAVLLEHAGMKVVGCAADGEEAVLATQRLKPDVVIMDLMLPTLNGIDATRRILHDFPRIHVIALSACNSPEHVYRALRAGVRGYVLKTAASDDLLRAVAATSAGDRYVSPGITALFVGGVLNTNIPQTPFDRLSTRERDVLNRIVAGFSSSDIASRLSLSPKTVDTYRSRIMVKLGVSNRSALIRLAREYELPNV